MPVSLTFSQDDCLPARNQKIKSILLANYLHTTRAIDMTIKHLPSYQSTK